MNKQLLIGLVITVLSADLLELPKIDRQPAPDRWPWRRGVIASVPRYDPSSTEAENYVFCRHGGWSWSIPYIADTYALAAQVEPEITPGRFRALALKTGDTIALNHEGKTHKFGPILNPVAPSEALRHRDLSDKNAVAAELASHNTDPIPTAAISPRAQKNERGNQPLGNPQRDCRRCDRDSGRTAPEKHWFPSQSVQSPRPADQAQAACPLDPSPTTVFCSTTMRIRQNRSKSPSFALPFLVK